MKRLFGTLIGYMIEVVSSSNVNYEGIRGVVIDETRNTILVKGDDSSIYRVIKKGCVFKLYHPNGEEYILNGGDLVGDIIRRVIEV